MGRQRHMHVDADRDCTRPVEESTRASSTSPSLRGLAKKRACFSVDAILYAAESVGLQEVRATDERMASGVVDDIDALSWHAVDRALRKALRKAHSELTGVELVVTDRHGRTVLYQTRMMMSKREELTRIITAFRERTPPRVTRERLQQTRAAACLGVHIRTENEPYHGIRPAGRRWVAVAKIKERPEPGAASHVVSIGSTLQPEDAARMRDIYVIGMWLDHRLERPPRLNYPLDEYKGITDYQSIIDLQLTHSSSIGTGSC